jgi:GNAT superfamily N-acetyltransferase
LELRADDLAPGDRGSAAPTAPLVVTRVPDPGHPDFTRAYALLWQEFGVHGGMETEAVIRDRLAWDPSLPHDGLALAYDLLVVRRDGAVVAVRDQSAVVRPGADGRPEPAPVVVHLSHALVVPQARRTGLAPWLRALPLHTARRCAAAAGVADAPAVLVAEMEAPDPGDPATGVRLRSYERAGFRKIDPARARYAQPDFRPPEVLASEAPRPLPFSLIVRRVGREEETAMGASEVSALVASLYDVYGAHVPERALAPLRADAQRWTAGPEPFALVPPTS